MKNSFQYQQKQLPLNYQVKIVENKLFSKPGIIQSVLHTLNGKLWFIITKNVQKRYP